ncbi:hypothetical protein [Streptomyces guryensis]|uniref:Uncharacterized protein n=1 Tax=Streptomyces guryensis TaxID=2886947 RepID=A0A9Q3VKK2_9ACTN|nr:hypothetical protein [Streptomyces guryensis]MCD9872736.1 hypothetical protein [Streptomyces guryensis]
MTTTTQPIPRRNLNGDGFRTFCQDDTGGYTAFCLMVCWATGEPLTPTPST